MYIDEIIVTILMIAAGITIGSLATMFIAYKVMLSDRVMKKITKASMKMTKKMLKSYTKMIED